MSTPTHTHNRIAFTVSASARRGTLHAVRHLVTGGTLYAELGTALLAILWGAWFFVYPFGGGPIAILTNAMPAWVFAVLLLCVGVFQTGAVIATAPRLRLVAVWCSMVSWGFIALLLAQKDRDSVAFPTSAVFCVASLLGVLQVAEDTHSRQHRQQATSPADSR